MVEKELVEDLRRLAAGPGEVRHLRIRDRKERDFTNHVTIDEEPPSPPEHLVSGEETREAREERSAHVRRAGPERDRPDAPALIHDVEERLDVLAERGRADRLRDLLETAGEIVDVGAATRPEVGMEGTRRLEIRDGGDDMPAMHLLRPAHAPLHHELAILRESE